MTLEQQLMNSAKQQVLKILSSLDVKKNFDVVRFNSSPAISIAAYLSRFEKYINRFYSLSPDSVDSYQLFSSLYVLILIYLQRLLQIPRIDKIHAIGPHRVFMILINFALKTLVDNHNYNKYMSKISGVGLKEYNHLEFELILMIDFNLHVSEETFKRYKNFLLPAENLQEDAVSSCSTSLASACKISIA